MTMEKWLVALLFSELRRYADIVKASGAKVER
jgi:hypothetical protein